MVGLYTRAAPFPNFSYPRRKGWFGTETNFSSDTATGSPHMASSGANVTRVFFAVKNWNKTAPLVRAMDGTLDLVTPSYKLAGTSTTQDAVIGIDHNNLPLALSRFIRSSAFANIAAASNSTFMRVLAIKHHFQIRNFSRFPLCIYYAVYPTGYEPEDLDTSTPLRDLQYSAYKKVIIPGVRDAGDKARKGHINLSLNLEKLFPQQYENPPNVKAGDLTSEEVPSPWMRVQWSDTIPQIITAPPGQQSPPTLTDTSPNDTPFPCGLNLKMYAKLDTDMYLGSTVPGTATSGDTDTNGFTIAANMNWLIDYVNMTQDTENHEGPKAYPDQTA